MSKTDTSARGPDPGQKLVGTLGVSAKPLIDTNKSVYAQAQSLKQPSRGMAISVPNSMPDRLLKVTG